MAYGITSAGFVIKTLDELKTEIEDAQRALFGAEINVSEDSVFDKLNGVFADRLSEVWELAQAAYSSLDPESATGDALDSLCAITGTVRLAESFSTVTVQLTGVDTTVVPAGTLFSDDGGRQVEVVSNTTISGVTDCACRAVVAGPELFVADTITNIDTPVSGLTSVNNALDTEVLGRLEETDSQLRLRRQLSLRAINGSSLDAMRARLLEIANVTDAYVFENNSDSTDANGLPPHSIECIVDGGTDADIVQSIFDSKPVGIATYGAESESVTDSEGNSYTLNFSRPEEIEAYFRIAVKVNPAKFPSDGQAQIKAAVAAYCDLNYSIGSEIRSSPLIPSVLGITGVVECGLPEISEDGVTWGTATIELSNREKPVADTSRITLTVTNAVGV